MGPEDVVDVLRAVHRALRPKGLLLDVHPEPLNATVHVRQLGRRAVRLGEIDERNVIGRIVAARAALANLVEAGAFVSERSARFTFLAHFASVDAWLAYRAARQTSSTVPESVISRARELLAANGGEVLVRDIVRAERLRKS